MPRYQFLGGTEMVFPTVATLNGSLVCQPGDVVDVDVDVDSVHLRLVDGSTPSTVAFVAPPEPPLDVPVEPVTDPTVEV